MEFVCAPLICKPLTAQQSIDLSIEKYQHLAGLDLADSHRGENEPMEVGSDYYWWFATGETRRGDL